MFKMIEDNYRIVKQIGSGQYGTVYSAFDQKKNRLVACKIQENDDLTETAFRK